MPWLSAHTPNALRATLVCTLALLCCATWAGDGRYRIVHAFEYNAETGTEGSRPSGGLMQASDGFLDGATTIRGTNGTGKINRTGPGGLACPMTS